MKDSSQLDNMNELLRLIAPGTPFREGLENVLRAKTGALLVVGYSPEVMEVVDGGFSINCDFSRTICTNSPRWMEPLFLVRI